VELAGVSLRYHRGSPWVLRNVEAKVGPGEAVLLTGRNGAGKSTLLQVIAGLLPTSRGSVVDRPVMVGWVPERFPSRQPFTARSYLEGVARVRGLDAAAARDAIGTWSERLFLTESLDTRLPELSKGSAQKVNLAQSLLVRPSLLVMDEPWEALDSQTRNELPMIITEVIDAGGCAIFSDHRGEAGELPGVRRWILDDGLLAEPEVGEQAARHVIEVIAPAAEAAATVARLRAAGYDVRGIRREVPGRPRRGPARRDGHRPDAAASSGPASVGGSVSAGEPASAGRSASAGGSGSAGGPASAGRSASAGGPGSAGGSGSAGGAAEGGQGNGRLAPDAAAELGGIPAGGNVNQTSEPATAARKGTS
jgi:ABC-2 type transport system ATP-binding protein